MIALSLSAALTVGLTGQAEASPVSLTNPGFETPEPTSNGRPNSTGDWSGDGSAIVAADNGIVPHSGNAMLRFDATSRNGAGVGFGSDVYQLVDVSAYQSAMSGSGVSATAGVYVNSVAGDASTDTAFRLWVWALSGTPATFAGENEGTALAEAGALFHSDADPNTWEPFSVGLNLPAGTNYLAVIVSGIEDVVNDTASPEFAGHYADSVSLDVVEMPEPGTAAVTLTALAVCCGGRRWS